MEKNIKIGDLIYLITSEDDYLDAVGSSLEPYMVKLFGAMIDSNDIVDDIVPILD